MFVCKIRPILGSPTRKTLSKNLLFYFGFPKNSCLLLGSVMRRPGFLLKTGSYNFRNEYSEFFLRFAEIVILTVRDFHCIRTIIEKLWYNTCLTLTVRLLIDSEMAFTTKLTPNVLKYKTFDLEGNSQCNIRGLNYVLQKWHIFISWDTPKRMVRVS